MSAKAEVNTINPGSSWPEMPAKHTQCVGP